MYAIAKVVPGKLPFIYGPFKSMAQARRKLAALVENDSAPHHEERKGATWPQVWRSGYASEELGYFAIRPCTLFDGEPS
jgi:hypothetical protein